MSYSNEYTELIYDFLDGELPQSDETRLFAALLNDADARTEFKQILTINAAIQDDTQAFTTLPSSDEAIFTRLGFAKSETNFTPIPLSNAGVNAAASAVSHTAVNTAPNLMSRSLPTLRRVGLVALIALLSSGLTAWLLGNRSDRMQEASNNGFLGNVLQMGMGNGVPPQSPYNQAFNGFLPLRPMIDTVYADTLFRTRTIVERVVVVQHDSIPLNDASYQALQVRIDSTVEVRLQARAEVAVLSQSKSADVVQHPSNLDSTRQSTSQQSISQQSSVTQTNPSQAAQSSTQLSTPFPVQVQPPLLGVNIGARGLLARSVIWASVQPAPEAFPTNTALFALYSLSPQHSIGAEFGRESFFQRFFYTDVRGVEYRVEQHPTLIWGGLAYRFSLLPEQNFSPFAHIVLGATQVSAIGRGMIGLTYKPDTRTQFLLGAEASSLFFQNDNTLYMAPKLGVSYGVSITF